MEKNNKHLIIAGIAIVVVIALAILVPHFKSKAVAPTTDTSTAGATADTATPAMATVSSGQADWDATIKKYENSTVAFAADCSASPVTQNLKQGTTVLLLNNSDVAHSIAIGTTTYNIGARHYKTMWLAGAGATVINCDSHANVANIAVE